jgi:hypothetical protein
MIALKSGDLTGGMLALAVLLGLPKLAVLKCSRSA